MKRNKHILINLDEYQYSDICYLASLDRRAVSDYIYLLVIDEIKKRWIDAHKDLSDFHKLTDEGDNNKIDE